MDTNKWFLMKYHDGALFGPIGFDVLRQWAVDALISPLDKVSSDCQTWIKAPMVPDLQMDYLLELSPNSFYGPTTVGAVREFLACGEITEETLVTNCKTGESRPLREFENFIPPVPEESDPVAVAPQPGIRQHLQARIRELEEALLEERRLRFTAEELRARAETRAAEMEKLLS